MQRNYPSGIAVVDEQSILVTAVSTPTTSIWFSTLRQEISPQYHLVFDNTFSTVYSDGTFNADVWNSLVTSNLELHDDAPSTVPSSFDFVDTTSMGGIVPSTDPITDVLSFIGDLPENLLTPTQFPSLPDDIDDHLPPSNDGPTASFSSLTIEVNLLL
jgi:hypothetical protein